MKSIEEKSNLRIFVQELLESARTIAQDIAEAHRRAAAELDTVKVQLAAAEKVPVGLRAQSPILFKTCELGASTAHLRPQRTRLEDE